MTIKQINMVSSAAVEQGTEQDLVFQNCFRKTKIIKEKSLISRWQRNKRARLASAVSPKVGLCCESQLVDRLQRLLSTSADVISDVTF